MTNNKIMKALGMKSSTFYYQKKKNPRLIELVTKGLLYEEALRSSKDNKHKQGNINVIR